MKDPVERNIPLFYIISSLGWSRFFLPVLALFYIASQVPFEQFTIIMGVFSLTILLLEVPTGVLADLLGKRKVILLSKFMYIIEVYILAFHDGFWPFLIAKIISGAGVSLASGADQALIYDTLKRLKREKEHKTISGTIRFVSNTSRAFVFVIGGFLFSISPKLTAIVSLPFMIVNFIAATFLIEPYKSKRSATIKNSWLQLKEGLHYFRNHGYIKYITLFSLPVSAAISIFLSSSSAYFEAILIPVSLIGVLAFISSISSGYMAKRAHRVEERLGEKKSIILSQIMPTLSVFLMALMIPKIGALFYFLIPVTQGFFEVIVNDYMNKHVVHSHRATMLSIQNMFDQLGIFITFPLVGYLTKLFSMQTAFLMFGGFIVVYLLVLALFSKKILGKHQLQ